jgi:hypothetical protein
VVAQPSSLGSNFLREERSYLEEKEVMWWSQPFIKEKGLSDDPKQVPWGQLSREKRTK